MKHPANICFAIKTLKANCMFHFPLAFQSIVSWYKIAIVFFVGSYWFYIAITSQQRFFDTEVNVEDFKVTCIEKWLFSLRFSNFVRNLFWFKVFFSLCEFIVFSLRLSIFNLWCWGLIHLEKCYLTPIHDGNGSFTELSSVSKNADLFKQFSQQFLSIFLV